jgi:biotin carboxyl carrier protein
MAITVDYRPFTVGWDGRLGSGPAPREIKPASSGGPAPGASRKGGVAAQIAGRVMSVKVKAGDAVKKGDVLLLLEAMKMENEIKAPGDGVVKEVLVVDGARVAEGETLVVIE